MAGADELWPILTSRPLPLYHLMSRGPGSMACSFFGFGVLSGSFHDLAVCSIQLDEYTRLKVSVQMFLGSKSCEENGMQLVTERSEHGRYERKRI